VRKYSSPTPKDKKVPLRLRSAAPPWNGVVPAFCGMSQMDANGPNVGDVPYFAH
jgi:hypothetical protein